LSGEKQSQYFHEKQAAERFTIQTNGFLKTAKKRLNLIYNSIRIYKIEQMRNSLALVRVPRGKFTALGYPWNDGVMPN
jgi:hypothetical protein